MYLLCFRLVHYFVKRKKTCENCRCRSDMNVTQAPISKPRSETLLAPSPSYVWTVGKDPIYEDIMEVKNKVESKEQYQSNISRRSDHDIEKKSSVQYGVITAKEVAKFVPCSSVVIRR